MLAVSDRLWLLALAMMIEGLIAYPDALYRVVGHPVTWIGAAIDRLELRFNRKDMGEVERRNAGVLVIGALVAAAILAGLVLGLPAAWTPFGLIPVLAIVFSLVAGGSLDLHVRAIPAALRAEGLEGGRREVANIVGRDPASLDEAGVCRAAIESLAENCSDGVVAPAFWFLVGSLPGMLAYKAINTADSMIGHKSERFRDFGWAAARLDDLVNLPASRLTALLLVLAAIVTPGTSPDAALAAIWRDAGKHRSPNAGWPEAAMAGALGLRLAGPRSYGGEVVDDAFMGDGRAEATADDIDRALRLYRTAMLIGWCGLWLTLTVLTVPV